MRIADICTRCVVHVDAGASVHAAAELMRKRHVGSLVVTEEPDGGRVPIGMITDRDIVLAVIAPGVDAGTLTVGDVMSLPLASCNENDDLFDVIGVMRRRGIRRLPVLNDKGSLAGLVSVDDVYAVLGTQLQELSQALTREQVREMETRT